MERRSIAELEPLLRCLFLALALVGLALASPSLAAAQTASQQTDPTAAGSTPPPDPTTPTRVPYVDRPLTLPRRTFSIDVDGETTSLGHGRHVLDGAIGLRYGATDDLTLQVVPLSGSADDIYRGSGRWEGWAPQNLSAGVTDRVLHARWGELALGTRFDLEMGAGYATFAVSPFAAAVFHVAHVLRIDTGVYTHLRMNNATGFDLASFENFYHLEPGLPVDLTFQIVDSFFAGVRSGVGLIDWGNNAQRIQFVALGGTAGVTVPRHHRPLMDILATFDFPTLVFAPLGDTQVSGSWQLQLGMRTYLAI